MSNIMKEWFILTAQVSVFHFPIPCFESIIHSWALRLQPPAPRNTGISPPPWGYLARQQGQSLILYPTATSSHSPPSSPLVFLFLSALRLCGRSLGIVSLVFSELFFVPGHLPGNKKNKNPSAPSAPLWWILLAEKLKSWEARLMNLHQYDRIVFRSEKAIRLIIKIDQGPRPITFPRRFIKLFPPDEVMIPEWLCRDRGLI